MNYSKIVANLPVFIKVVGALVQGQRLDEVLFDLAGLWLHSGSDVNLQGAVLSLNGPDLQLQPRGVGLAPVGG